MIYAHFARMLIRSVKVVRSDSILFLELSCLGLIWSWSAFQWLFMEEGTALEARVPGLNESKWSFFATCFWHRTTALLGVQKSFLLSPCTAYYLKESAQTKHFIGVCSECVLIILVVLSVWFLFLQSSKGAVNQLIVNLRAAQSVHACSGSFNLIVNCTVCASVYACFFSKLPTTCAHRHRSICVHTHAQWHQWNIHLSS